VVLSVDGKESVVVAQHENRSADAANEDRTGPRITVTEWPDTILGNVIDAYSYHAFERGYQVAVTELIASLLPATEAFLRDHSSGTVEVRETLYRFERFLAQRFDANTRAEQWVEGGSSI
jgi:hypothetical protein